MEFKMNKFLYYTLDAPPPKNLSSFYHDELGRIQKSSTKSKKKEEAYLALCLQPAINTLPAESNTLVPLP